MLNRSVIFVAIFIAATVGLRAFAQTTTPIDKSDVEKWREDLRFMASEMPKRHKNLFHQMSREQFETAVKTLDDRIPTLARHQIIVEMARIVAMVGDGHTNISPTRDPKIGFHSYPIKLYFFSDGLFIRAANQEHPDIVGWRVIKIGKMTAEQAYAAVRDIIGRDNEMDARFFAPHLLTMPEVDHALGITTDAVTLQLTLEKGGARKSVELRAAGLTDMMPSDTDTSWVGNPAWVDARDTDKTPLWLKDPSNKFWYQYLPESQTVYVQVNQIGNKTDETIEAFSKRLFTFVEGNTVNKLVLDLRLNRGGNGELNIPLVRAIIKSKIDQKGKLFAIIGRSTFSAAQFLINDLEKYAIVTFVGEPSGGKVNSYGDSVKITLPNSGITVRVSSLWWQQDGRDTRQWTSPEIASELSFEDYQTGVDPALKAILNYSKQRSIVDQISEAVEAGDLKHASEIFRKWRAEPANKYRDPERSINALGYQFIERKQLKQAIEVLKLNVEAFPGSANAYDSLAEAYLSDGDKESAIRNYEKALQLDPRMSSTAEALKRLKGVKDDHD